MHLTAYQGIGLQASDAERKSSVDNVASVCETREPLELLSGFVSYEQVADAMGDSSRSTNLFRRQEETILSLRGPGMLYPAPM